MSQHKSKTKKVKCPRCESLHTYTEIIFPSVNDSGVWEIECQECDQIFYVKILNPRESFLDPNYLVKRRLDDEQGLDPKYFASDVIEYNFNLNDQRLLFSYETSPLFVCPQTGANLEIVARDVLSTYLTDICKEYAAVVSYYLKGSTNDFEFAVVSTEIPCKCAAKHVVTFYCKFAKTGSVQRSISEYLLADITETDLTSHLDGLFSKADVMSFLEKLLIRWNLLCDQVIITVPFVGHQYLSKESKMCIWNWFLTMLDPKKSIFVSRAATFGSYRSILEDVEGLNDKVLRDFDLENRIISANTKKNDFHAKFFAGVLKDRVEVMSGSANLVTGPSLENISFKHYSREAFDMKYVNKLKIAIPAKKISPLHYIKIMNNNGTWSVASRTRM